MIFLHSGMVEIIYVTIYSLGSIFCISATYKVKVEDRRNERRKKDTERPIQKLRKKLFHKFLTEKKSLSL